MLVIAGKIHTHCINSRPIFGIVYLWELRLPPYRDTKGVWTKGFGLFAYSTIVGNTPLLNAPRLSRFSNIVTQGRAHGHIW